MQDSTSASRTPRGPLRALHGKAPLCVARNPLPHADVHRDAGDCQALKQGWLGQQLSEYTGEAYIQTTAAFCVRAGTQPRSGPAVVRNREKFVRLESQRRANVESSRLQSLNSVRELPHVGDMERELDLKRLANLILTHLEPEELDLVHALCSNQSAKDWQSYEQAHGVSPNARYKRVHTLRARLRHLLPQDWASGEFN